MRGPDCVKCGEGPARCWCPCPACGKSSTADRNTPEACQCSYEDLAAVLRARDSYAEGLEGPARDSLAYIEADYNAGMYPPLVHRLRSALAAKNSIPAGANCATCKGSGWITTSYPKELDGSGKPFDVSCPDCTDGVAELATWRAHAQGGYLVLTVSGIGQACYNPVGEIGKELMAMLPQGPQPIDGTGAGSSLEIGLTSGPLVIDCGDGVELREGFIGLRPDGLWMYRDGERIRDLSEYEEEWVRKAYAAGRKAATLCTPQPWP